MQNNSITSQTDIANVTVVTEENQIIVPQPITSVIEVNNPGPQGPVGPTGPQGPSVPFSNIGGGVYATTSSIQVTGSFLVSGSSTFTNIGPAIFSGSTSLVGATTMSSALVSGNVTVLGTASIGTLVVNQTVLSTGSNQLGDSANDTQTLFGSVIVPTGSLTVSGSARISGDIDTSGSIVSTNTFTNLGNFSTGIGLSKTTNNSSTLYSDIVSIQGTARSYNNFAYRVYGVKGIGGTDGGFSAQSIDTVTGVQGFISIGNGNKSVTSVMSLYGAASIVGTGNTVTNYYGLFLETPVGSTITNNWGVYQQSTGSKNYFGGNVGIGTLTPSYLLDVNGTSRLNGVAQISSINLGVSNNSQLADLSGVMELKGYNGFSLKAWQSGWGSGTTAVTITTDGKVGIGNTAPDYPLHITRNSTNNYIQLSGNTSKGIFAEGSGLLAFDTAGNLGVYTGGVNLRATFTSTGNLGIGTASPDEALVVNTTGSGTGIKLAGTGIPLSYTIYNGSTRKVILGYATGANNWSAGSKVDDTILSSAASVMLSSGNNSILYASSSGNVGIGTTTPALTAGFTGTHIKSATNFGSELRLDTTDADRNASLTFSTANTNKWQVFLDSTDGSLKVRDMVSPVTTPLVISDGGNVGINTGSAQYNLDVNGTARVGAAAASGQLYIKGLSGTGQYLYFDNGSVANGIWTMAGATVFVFDSATTRIWRISPSAQMTINGNTNDSSAQFQVESTTRGFLPPRTSATSLISSPAQGLITYVTGANDGLYYYNSGSQPGWHEVLTNTGSQSITGSLEVRVNSATSTNNALRLSNTQGNAGIGTGLVFYSDTNPSQGVFNTGRIYSDFPGFLYTDARMIFQTPTADSTWTDTLTLKGSSVGIGTTSPTFRLEVQGGDVRFANALTIGTGGGTGFTFSSNTITSIQNTFFAVDVVGSNRHFNITNSSTSTYYFRVAPSTGNIIIGGTIDTGAKLNIRSSGATSATQALRVENTNASASMVVLDNGFVGINTGSAQYNLDVNGTARITGNIQANGFYTNAANGIGWFSPATAIRISTNDNGANIIANNTPYFSFANNGTSITRTSGTGKWFELASFVDFSPTSGTTTMDWLSIAPTINQTGGANGITRGIYINPTLTSAPNWRAIEVTSGSVIFGSTGSGFYWDSTNLGLAIGGTTLDTGYALQINSAKGIRISGSGAGSGYSLLRGSESSFFANNGSAGVLGSTNTLTFLTADVERIRIGSSGDVGIGTNSPTYKLDVSGSGGATARFKGSAGQSTVSLNDGTNDNYIVGLSGRLQLRPSGNTTFTALATGEIGIGTITPTYKLDVYGTYHQSQSQGEIARYDIANANADQNRGVWNFYTNASATADFFGRFGFKFEGGVTDAYKQFQVHIGDSTTPKFIINGSGNVGVGTITPAGKLDLYDSTASSLYVRIGSVGANWVTGTTLSQLGTYTDHPLVFKTNDVARMRIVNTTGNVLIGTTTDAGFKLDVNGSTRVTGSLTLTGSLNVTSVYTTISDTVSSFVGGVAYIGSNFANIQGNLGVGSFGNPGVRLNVRGSGATNATTTFLLQNSTPTNLLSVLDNGQVAFTSPTMSLAASQSAFSISPIISASNVVGGQYYGVSITPTFFQTTGSQTETAFRVAATFTSSNATATSGSNIIADFGSTSAGSQLTVTDVTSGSIYMVNDVSGIPIIEATSNWDVNMYDFPNKVFEKTGSQVNIYGTMRISGSFILPLSQSATPQTGSAYWSGSLLFIYNGTRYMSSSFA